MAEIDPVILQLRADYAKYQADLKSTTNFVTASLDRQERAILSLDKEVNSATRRISASFSTAKESVAGFVGGFALGAVLREMAGLADQAKQLDAQLRLATNGFGTFAQGQADVQRLSSATRSSLEATTKLYAGFLRASNETGRSQQDAARATETFAKAIKIGGASTEEAASATLQFNQALQSGVLRGDEFNSILEASPRIARLLAEALGIPIGQLRGLAEQGKITSDVLFRALTDRKFTAGIDAEFKQVPVTFGDAMQAIENTALTTFGKFDRGGQFSDALVSLLSVGTDSFDGLTNKAEQFGRDTRAVFDGFANLFEPLRANGFSVFDALGIRIYSVRDQIQSLLDSLDRFANFDANIENSVKRGFNRAIDRAGGGQHFQETPLQNLGGRFRAGARLSEARSRRDSAAARLEALGYVVPRNSDGSINEAGIVRRQSQPRPAYTPASPAKPKKARASRSRSSSATDDLPTTAEILSDIAKDLDKITREGADLMRSDSEQLDRAAKNFRSVVGKEGEDYVNPFAGVADYDRQQKEYGDALEESERRAQDVREHNVYQLANLYESLFQEGTDGLWRNFKDQGLRALALIAAQATVSSFLTPGGGGFGSFLKNLGGGLSTVLGGGGFFGRASGGYVAPYSTVSVNEGGGRGPELLRMGGQGGTVIPLGQTNAVARGTPNVTIHQHFTLDARQGITTPQLLSSVDAIMTQRGAEARDQAVSIARKGLPAVSDRYGKLGTTG